MFVLSHEGFQLTQALSSIRASAKANKPDIPHLGHGPCTMMCQQVMENGPVRPFEQVLRLYRKCDGSIAPPLSSLLQAVWFAPPAAREPFFESDWLSSL
jgi:hypothetical protein